MQVKQKRAFSKHVGRKRPPTVVAVLDVSTDPFQGAAAGAASPVGEGVEVKNRPKKRDFDHLGQLLNQVLGACRKNPDMALHRVWDIWDETLGAGVSQNARPTAFKGRLLVVSVSSSAWLHHLRFQKAEMIARLNAALEDARVDDIKFKIGAVGDSPDN